MYVICIWCFSLNTHHYFGKCGYANYLLWVMVISGPYMSFSFWYMFIIFWGTTSRPVGVAYRLYILCVFLYCFYLWCWWLSFAGRNKVGGWYTDIYTYLRRMGLAGSFGIGVYYYVYWYLTLFGARAIFGRVVCCPSNRWTLSVFLQKLEIYFKSRMRLSEG